MSEGKEIAEIPEIPEIPKISTRFDRPMVGRSGTRTKDNPQGLSCESEDHPSNKTKEILCPHGKTQKCVLVSVNGVTTLRPFCDCTPVQMK